MCWKRLNIGPPGLLYNLKRQNSLPKSPTMLSRSSVFAHTQVSHGTENDAMARCVKDTDLLLSCGKS